MTIRQRLYGLMPAIYRRRDEEAGGPLQALLGVMEEELDRLGRDIDQLRENAFIETCEEWAAPYIGELIGVRGFHPGVPGVYSLRALVANALALRRRKGGLAALEQTARDATGWTSRAVEFRRLLAFCQNARLPSPERPAWTAVRPAAAAASADSPFDVNPHAFEAREAEAGGRYGLAAVGVFVWPLQVYRVHGAEARPAPGKAGCWTFHPLGLDAPLYNPPQTEGGISQTAAFANTPAALKRDVAAEALERLRRRTVLNEAVDSTLFTGERAPFEIAVNGAPTPPEQLVIADLSDWSRPTWVRPAAQKAYQVWNVAAQRLETVTAPIAAVVDPELGRIALAGAVPADAAATVGYAYAAGGDLGGGPYNRGEAALAATAPGEPAWRAGVSRDAGDNRFATLQEALAAWNGQPEGVRGVIAMLDNRLYGEPDALDVTIKDGQSLAIVAARLSDAGGLDRLTPEGVRPALRGPITVTGSAAAQPGALTLDGLLIEGGVRVAPGNMGLLRIAHCTLAGPRGELRVEAGDGDSDNRNLCAALERAIIGPIRLDAQAELTARECVIDGDEGLALSTSLGSAFLSRCTVFGEVAVRRLDAEDSVFAGDVRVTLRQQGEIRYSYLPEGSTPPRLFRCQPAMALDGVENPALRAELVLRLRPSFESTAYGRPDYAWLSRGCAVEIREGAANRAEMGVFNYLKQPQREDNLRRGLAEQIRLGKQAGALFIV